MLKSGGNPSIAAGNPSSARQSVELHNMLQMPYSNALCYIDNLPSNRYYHTSVGGVICGGSGSAEHTSCIDLSGGSWSTMKFQSIRSRYRAVTWNLNPGKFFMILGGVESGNRKTTDIVHTNGTVEPGFDLQYDSL